MTDKQIGGILVMIALAVALAFIVMGNDAGSATEVALLK